MNIENRIKALQPYVIQMRFTDGIAVVDVVFKEGWKVPSSNQIESIKGNDDTINYYMFYTLKENLGLDNVLDYIEQVININIEREKKYELLKVKTEELKEVFRKNSLVKLQGMKFVLGDEKLLPDIMPPEFDDINIEDIDTPTIIVKDKIQEEVKTIDNNNITPTPSKKKINNQTIELPPKGKIELENFEEPKLVCNCIGDDVCPVCIEEKMAY